MAEHERGTQGKNGKVEQKHRVRQQEFQPSLDQSHAWEQESLSLTEAPFYPRMDEHAAILSSIPFSAQRHEFMIRLHQTYGNRYVQRLIESVNAQTKLNVSTPNDVYEQEADRVADTVTKSLNTPAQRQEEEGEEVQMQEEEEELQAKPVLQRQAEEEEELQTKPLLQRQAEQEEEELLQTRASQVQRDTMEDERAEETEEEEELQAKPVNSIQRQAEEEEEEVQTKPTKSQPTVVPEDLETKINEARGSGQPISEEVRVPMEQTFGTDFSGVKVHTDTDADTLSKSLQARAFTTKQDIFFKSGEYSPGSSSGQQLLAHELTHVVQQGGGGTLGAAQQDGEPATVQGILSKTAGIQRGKLIEERVRQHEREIKKAKGLLRPPPVPTYKPWKQKGKRLEERKVEVKAPEEKKAEVKAPEEKKTEVKAPEEKKEEEKKIEEPYEYKPSESFDGLAYSKALEKFKPMRKPRIMGGLKKSDRRLEALKYLKETVAASKGSHPNPQKVVNSIMEAYRDTFGEELKEGAPKKLGAKEKLVIMGQKIREFVNNVFSIQWWAGKLIELKETLDLPAAITDQTKNILTLLGGGFKSLADKITPYIAWLPIVGIVSSIIDVIKGIGSTISKFMDMIALGKTADAAQKKEEPSAALLADAAVYGYNKVLRGFLSQFYDLIISVANFVLSILGVIGGVFTAGIGLAITTGISIGLTLVSLAKKAMTKLKGIWKWLLGKRGKARRENAKKIVIAAREGSDEALNLILKLDLSGIAGGTEWKQFWYWLRSWGAKGEKQNKQMLVDMLKGWDEKVIDTVVKGVADKLKSQ